MLDDKCLLIASGGTAGFCAIALKKGSPYGLEYAQAWLSHWLTERIVRLLASDFEGGFIGRGTYVLPHLPFIPLDLADGRQASLYKSIVDDDKELLRVARELAARPSAKKKHNLKGDMADLAQRLSASIERVYDRDF